MSPENTEQPETTGQTTGQTLAVAPLVAMPLPTAIKAHVYPNKSDAAKAPLYRVECELPAPLEGITIELPIFAERDARGTIKALSCSMPGGRFQSIKPLPMFVTGADGKVYPVSRSEDPKGAANLSQWQAKAVEAVYKFQKTGEAIQYLTF